MYIYVVTSFDEVDIATADIKQADAELRSYSSSSMQVWENGKEIMDIWYSKVQGGYQTNIDSEDKQFKEIVKRLK